MNTPRPFRGPGAIEVPRAAELYADLIRSKILSGDIEVGAHLPPERTMVEDSGLTRAAVREALQLLQHQGLIVTRPGRGGGSIAARPDASAFMSSVDLQLQGWAPGSQMLFEARQVIEPWCAALAAERATDEDLALLDDINAEAMQCRSSPEFIENKVRWHAALAAAAHNELLSTFMEAVGRAIIRQTDADDHGEPESRAQSVRAHRSVTDAVRLRDRERAHHAMGRHVHAPPIAYPKPVVERSPLLRHA